MKRRLFIAINLPVKIKEKLEAQVDELKRIFTKTGLDIRFLAPENWHLTISFLSYQEDENLNSIIEAIRTTTGKFTNPKIELEELNYGPFDVIQRKPLKRPRMIWFIGSKETSQKLTLIKEFLEKELINRGIKIRQEHRLFNSHLTLAKFAFSKEVLPNIKKLFKSEFEAKSLDLMESHLKRTGAEYEILSSFDFKKE